jgi:hypothetical protein
MFRNPDGGTVYFKYIDGTKSIKTDEGKRISKNDLLFHSDSGDEGSFVNFNTIASLRAVLDYIGEEALNAEGLQTTSSKKQIITRMKELGIRPSNAKPNYIGYRPERRDIPNPSSHHIVGIGMHSDPKDIPSKVQFGDKVIDLRKLYLKNILSLSTPTGLKIHGIKNTPVSDGFVKVIFDIYNGKDLLSKDLGGLSSNEKVYLDTVLSASGLHRKHNTGGKAQSIDKIKNDYEIVIGEIQSGNNGSEIKKKLYSILHTLSNLGSISKSQADRQYRDICKNYF